MGFYGVIGIIILLLLKILSKLNILIDLYKGGLQRSNFLPFIKSLKENCNVLNLNSPKDYRMEGTTLDKTFFLWDLKKCFSNN